MNTRIFFFSMTALDLELFEPPSQSELLLPHLILMGFQIKIGQYLWVD